MKNIAIVCDSGISLTKEEVKEYDVYIMPFVIMHNDAAYIDQVTITNTEVYDILGKKEKLTTSQPNIGEMIETFEMIQEKNYDDVFVLSISSELSGAYNAFNQAIKDSGLENYHLIDTHSIAGPSQQGVRAIREMNKAGKSIEEILEYLELLFANTVSYLYPDNFDQVVASGRLSKSAGAIIAFLQVKAVLYLKKKGKAIENLGMAGSDQRIYATITKDFKKNKVKPETHDLYFLESNAEEKLEEIKDFVFKDLGEFKFHLLKLPAVLTVHAGVGAVAVQFCPKIPQ